MKHTMIFIFIKKQSYMHYVIKNIKKSIKDNLELYFHLEKRLSIL